jgi:hypothetical protein
MVAAPAHDEDDGRRARGTGALVEELDLPDADPGDGSGSEGRQDLAELFEGERR